MNQLKSMLACASLQTGLPKWGKELHCLIPCTLSNDWLGYERMPAGHFQAYILSGEYVALRSNAKKMTTPWVGINTLRNCLIEQ
jgi:hypothetical protein